MPAFLFLCPATGLRVQGWTAADPSTSGADAFEAVTCHACGQLHLVNPQSGKTVGIDAREAQTGARGR